jgi:YHS domain-containing protein
MFLRGVLIVLIGGGSLLACQSSSSTSNPAATSGSAATAETNGLARVEDASKVCMVTDQFMGTAQIPVEVEGTTYFGCCEMCKARLANEPQTRTAKDPVSGEPVDKAKAVIGREPSGKVHYFASAENLARYRIP